MRAFRFSVLLVLAVAAVAVVAGGAAASPGKPHPSAVVGHVYVNDNTAPVNSIAGFDRHADGSLTPVPGSPFAIGGSGTGHPDASQGSLEQSADGRYLLAVDAGSNQISVLQIKPDGSPPGRRRLAGASGGVDPVSIGVHRDLVYVANAGPRNHRGRHQLHRLPAQPRRPPAGDSQLDLRASERLEAGPGAVQRRRDQGRRHPHRDVRDRQLHRRPRRAADSGRRLAL
jgi:hypothetical protein